MWFFSGTLVFIFSDALVGQTSFSSSGEESETQLDPTNNHCDSPPITTGWTQGKITNSSLSLILIGEINGSDTFVIHEHFKQEDGASTSLSPVCLRCMAAQKTAMVWGYMGVCERGCVCVCARAWVGTWVYELCSSLHEMTGLVVVFFIFLRLLNAITVLWVILLFLGFWDIPLWVVIQHGLRLVNLQLKPNKIRTTKILYILINWSGKFSFAITQFNYI